MIQNVNGFVGRGKKTISYFQTGNYKVILFHIISECKTTMLVK